MTEQRAAVGLIGGMCSGKNTFGEFFVNAYGEKFGGARVVSSSDAARAYIAHNELGEPTRDLTRHVASHLRNKYGPHYLVDWALQQADPQEGLIIVSGIYTVPESQRISEVGGVNVAIHAAAQTRRQRMVTRSRTGEVEINEFSRLDNEDMHATTTDQRVADVLQLADIHIHDQASSDRTRPLYVAAAEQILSRLRRG